MKLLLDIGNSRAKWALAEDGAPISPGGARGACGYFADPDWPRQLPAAGIDSIWFASVAAPAAAEALRTWAREAGLPAPRQVVTSAAACGVTNAYARPERLGVDRWLACIGAYGGGRMAAPVLIADAGTALTLDLVGADGRHRGGLICPGVAAMRGALAGDTQVRAADAAFDPGWLAADTDAAVGLGTLQAALALIERARRALAPRRLLLTGGEAALLAPHLDRRWRHVPDLVLEGLALAASEIEAATGNSRPETGH